MATAKKVTTASKIRNALTKYPDSKVSAVARMFNVSPAYVYQVKTKMGTPKTPKQQWKVTHISTSNEPLFGRKGETPITMEEPKADNVNHPAHYKVGGIETIDFLEAKLTPEEFRGYLRGNVLKYLSRAGNKGNYEEDMLKARWYLNREASRFGK